MKGGKSGINKDGEFLRGFSLLFFFFYLKKKKKDNWKETENLLLTYQRPNVIASFVFQEKLGE
jgi:hypothetical protein